MDWLLANMISSIAPVYNIANSGVTSWYDFTRQIFHLSGKQCAVNPILSSDYPSPVERPSYSVLDQVS
jgi:dTDP-4-dehydrorhamnose reductase